MPLMDVFFFLFLFFLFFICFFQNINNLPSFIISAFFADRVRDYFSFAMRTERIVSALQSVMRANAIALALRMFHSYNHTDSK